MATKNLVPRLDNEGKLGLEDTTPKRRWAEVNAVSGSFNHLRVDKIDNLDGQPILQAGDNITIQYIENGSLGNQYEISSTGGSQSQLDKIIEQDTSVEVVDTETEQLIKFNVNDILRWKIKSDGHFLPETSNALDIGSSSNKINNIYLNSDLKLNNSTLSENANSRISFSYNTSSLSEALPLTKHVTVATTVNLDLTSTSLTQIDSVDLTNGDRVLVKNQTTQSENGIYVFNSGALTRATDFASLQSFENIIVNIRQGSINGGDLYHSLVQASNGSSIIGTNDQAWVQINNEGIQFSNLSEISDNLADADTFIINDTSDSGGTSKTLLASKIKDYIYSGVSGDATINSSGVLTIESGQIDSSKIANNHITFSDGTEARDSDISLNGTLTISGTANEVDVVNTNGIFTLGLPDAVTVQSLNATTSATIKNITLSGQSSPLSLNTQKITNLATPSELDDAATKGYVDNLAQGLVVNNAVKAATTGNITLSGTQPIDDIAISADERVLVKDQTTASENGIYECKTGAWVRASDMAANSNAAGVFMFVEQGTLNSDKGFVCTSNSGSDTVGTHALTFTQFSSAGQITAGNGLEQSGSAINAKVDNVSLEISNDVIRVKTSGITNAMLNGGITPDKLNKITGNNKVSLTSIDFENETLSSLANNDKFIVRQDSSTNTKSLYASKIPEFVFGKVTGDVLISNTGEATIQDNAVETAMLNKNVITGQSAKTTVNDNDLVLIVDSQDSNSLKKIKKSDFIQGSSANVDFASLTEVTSTLTNEFDEILINDKTTENGLGVNKKIKAKDLVRNSFLFQIEKLNASTSTTIQPNTIVLLDNGASRKYDITLNTSNAKDGDIIKVMLDIDQGDLNEIVYVQSLYISNLGYNTFSANDLKGSGLELVYESNSWKLSGRPSKWYKTYLSSEINLSTNPAEFNYKLFALRGSTSNTRTIKLPSQARLASWGLAGQNNTSLRTIVEIEFIAYADYDVVIQTFEGSTLVKQQILGRWTSAGPTPVDSLSFKLKNHTRFKATWDFERNLWYIEYPNVNLSSISLADLSDVNWNPNDNNTSQNTLLVSKTSSPGQIYGEKLTADFIKQKDSNGDAGITRLTISNDAIGTSEIENNKVTKEKIEKVSPYRLLGHVNSNNAEGSAIQNIQEVKVYTDFSTHETDVSNSQILEHSSLPTTQAVKNLVDNSLSSLNITASEQGARSLSIGPTTGTLQLEAADINKTTDISWTLDSNATKDFTNTIPLFTRSKVSSFKSMLTSRRHDVNAQHRVFMPKVSSGGSDPSYIGVPAGTLLQVHLICDPSVNIASNVRSIVFLPHAEDPSPGTGSTTIFNNTVFIRQEDATLHYDWGNIVAFPYSGKKYIVFELIKEIGVTGPNGSTIDTFTWLLRK